jgi:hypothetical protein
MVMKRVLQSVALALAVLLAVQPALASMTCTQMHYGAGHHSADCCPRPDPHKQWRTAVFSSIPGGKEVLAVDAVWSEPLSGRIPC